MVWITIDFLIAKQVCLLRRQYEVIYACHTVA